MPTLQEEFEAYKASQRQSRAFQIEKEYEAYKKDMAQGGSIRTAPHEENFPLGAAVGAIGGSLTGNPMLVPLFAAGGEAAQQLIERAVDSPAAPLTTQESALRMAREGTMAGLGEVVGSAVGLPLRGGAFAGTVMPRSLKAQAFLEGKGLQSGILPAEMTSSRVLDIMHNVSEHSLLGGGAIKTFKENRDAFFRGLADEIVDRFGPRMDADQAGQAVVDATTRNLELAKAPARLLYNRLDQEAAPEYFNTIQSMKVAKQEVPVTKEAISRMTVKKKQGPSSKEFLDAPNGPESLTDPPLHGLKVVTRQQELQIGERLERLQVMTTTAERQIGGPRIDLRTMKDELAGAFAVAERAGGIADREMGNTLLSFIKSKPDIVSYPVAKAMRTEVRTLRETLERSIEAKNAPAIEKAKEIYAKLSSAIKDGLNKYDPNLANMWEEANALTLAAHEKFNSRIIRQLVHRGNLEQGGKPEAIVDAIFRPNNVTTITKVRAAVDPEDWGKLQSVAIQRIFEKAADDLGTPLGNKLEKQLFGTNGLGAPAVDAAFGQAFSQDMRGFVNALKVVQEKQSEGTGRMLVQLKQGGAFLELAGATVAAMGLSGPEHDYHEIAGGAGIILTPWMLGKLMTTPHGARWLTEGFSTMKHAPRAAKLAGQILQAAIPRSEIASAAQSAEQIQTAPSLQTRPFGGNQQ